MEGFLKRCGGTVRKEYDAYYSFRFPSVDHGSSDFGNTVIFLFLYVLFLCLCFVIVSSLFWFILFCPLLFLLKYCPPLNFTGDLVLVSALYICCRQINRLCGVHKSILLKQQAGVWSNTPLHFVC